MPVDCPVGYEFSGVGNNDAHVPVADEVVWISVTENFHDLLVGNRDACVDGQILHDDQGKFLVIV